MSNNDDGGERNPYHKPIPQPRRNNAVYDNVLIDSCNKSTTLNNENVLMTYLPKVLNVKVSQLTENHSCDVLNMIGDDNSCLLSADGSLNDLNLDGEKNSNKQFPNDSQLPVAAPRNRCEINANEQSTTGAIKKQFHRTAKLSESFLSGSGVVVDNIYDPVDPIDNVSLELVRRHPNEMPPYDGNYNYVEDTSG